MDEDYGLLFCFASFKCHHYCMILPNVNCFRGRLSMAIIGPSAARPFSYRANVDWWWRWRRNVSFSISASLSLFSALTLYSHAHLWSIKLSLKMRVSSNELFSTLNKRCGCHARWLYRRTDRSLGAVAGRLAENSGGTCKLQLPHAISAAWQKMRIELREHIPAVARSKVTWKRSQKVFVLLVWTRRAGMNRRVAFEAGFRFSRPASARDVSAPCRRHLTGWTSRLERVASSV